LRYRIRSLVVLFLLAALGPDAAARVVIYELPPQAGCYCSCNAGTTQLLINFTTVTCNPPKDAKTGLYAYPLQASSKSDNAFGPYYRPSMFEQNKDAASCDKQANVACTGYPAGATPASGQISLTTSALLAPAIPGYGDPFSSATTFVSLYSNKKLTAKDEVALLKSLGKGGKQSCQFFPQGRGSN
jgi:hypothetical protein